MRNKAILNKIQHFPAPTLAQSWCEQVRHAGHSIGFVATMGALHQGHLALFKRAKAQNDLVIASIFVNPLQFNHAEDLQKYPRDLSKDTSQLQSAGVDALFTGSAEAMLGDARDLNPAQLSDPGLYAKGLEGAYRPGHFAGVREVVSRLFHFVGPCRAYFGEKDYQQVRVIQQLAATFDNIEIISCPTSRQASGLARSSRNQRLSKQSKRDAAIIYQAMQAAAILWSGGERFPQILQLAMLETLSEHIIDLDYAEIRDPNHWTETQPKTPLNHARAFIAGSIEGVRLIDNMALGDLR